MTVGRRLMCTSQSLASYSEAYLRHCLQHRALGSSAFQVAKVSSSESTSVSCRPFQRTGDGSSADLLPIAPGLLVAHEEVLIVDAGQMKRQPPASDISLHTRPV